MSSSMHQYKTLALMLALAPASASSFCNQCNPYDQPDLGRMYAVDGAGPSGTNDLYEIDPVFLDATRVGSTGISTDNPNLGVVGLAADPRDCQLYAIANNFDNPCQSYFYRVNSKTGEATLITELDKGGPEGQGCSAACSRIPDITIMNDGTLYAICVDTSADTGDAYASELITIDKTNGDITVIQNHGFRYELALATNKVTNRLYLKEEDTIYQLDPDSGLVVGSGGQLQGGGSFNNNVMAGRSDGIMYVGDHQSQLDTFIVGDTVIREIAASFVGTPRIGLRTGAITFTTPKCKAYGSKPKQRPPALRMKKAEAPRKPPRGYREYQGRHGRNYDA